MWTSLGHGPVRGMRSLQKAYGKSSIGTLKPYLLPLPGVWISGGKQQQQQQHAQHRARAITSPFPAAADHDDHEDLAAGPVPSLRFPQYDSEPLDQTNGLPTSEVSGGSSSRRSGTRSGISGKRWEAAGGNAGTSHTWKKISRTRRYEGDDHVSATQWESRPNHPTRHRHRDSHDNGNNGNGNINNGCDRFYPPSYTHHRKEDARGFSRLSESHRFKGQSSSSSSPSSSLSSSSSSPPTFAMSPSAAAAEPANEPSWSVIGFNQQIKGAKTCQQLVLVLRNPRPGALTAVNVATAWVRLGNMRSRGGGRKPAGADTDTAREEEGATMAACTAAVRQLLEPTAAAAAKMELRQIANTLWGMAKVGESTLYAHGIRHEDDNKMSYISTSPSQALQQLQNRAIELLQMFAPGPGGGSSSDGAGRRALLQMDVRDATQLWYGMAGLSQHPWSDGLRSGLEEASLQAMEAAVLYKHSGRDVSAAPGSRGGRSGGGGWEADLTATAQIVFRMACVSGARMIPEHKTRLTAVIDALSYSGDDSASPLENPDCLLVGAQLLKLDLAKETVRRLHDMALALPPAAAARTGRTAMARALNSAVGLGLQPSASDARRWEQRLLEELAVDGGSYDRWTSEGLSWTMLALSGVKAYLPGAETREILLGGLRRVVRQMRSNDATRVQHAMRTWGLRLPEREGELLRRKASDGGGAEWSEPGRRGGGKGGDEYGARTWGFGR